MDKREKAVRKLIRGITLTRAEFSELSSLSVLEFIQIYKGALPSAAPRRIEWVFQDLVDEYRRRQKMYPVKPE